MKRTIASFFSTLLIFTLSTTSLHAASVQSREVTRIRTILQATADHLAQMQTAEGRYRYEYNPFTDIYTKDDNIVRQIGTLYAMAKLFEVFGDRVYLERMKKTANYWLAHSQTTVRDGKTLRYFLDNTIAKLGSSALFIIGTKILEKEDPAWAVAHKAELGEIEAFVLWMQKANGGFAAEFRPGMTTNDKENAKSSDFFDGEAFLALVVMYEYEADQNLRAAIYKTVAYIEKTYTASYATGLYLWVMTASKQAYEVFKDERFARLAAKQEEIKDKTRALSTSRTFTHNVCTDFEGLGHWLLLEKTRGIDHPEHEKYVKFGLSKLSALQLKKSSRMKVEINGLRASFRPLPQGVGGFVTDLKSPVQRIDFQQHCIMAFSAQLQLLE